MGGETRGTFFPFLIQDRTPREQRAYPQGKPVTKEFRGVTRVVIAVRNLDDAIQRYRQAYGVPRPIKQVDQSFEGYLALLGNLPVVLAQPLNAGSWLTERIERFGEGPCAFVLGAVNPGHFQAASRHAGLAPKSPGSMRRNWAGGWGLRQPGSLRLVYFDERCKTGFW